MWGFWGSVITALLALVGVIITNKSSNDKIAADLKVSQAVTNEKIETLTKSVERHNAFGQRIPVIEEQIKVINHRIDDLERSTK